MADERSYKGWCPKHKRRRPCYSCRAGKAGRVMTEKKRKANAAKAKEAAMKRWHPELSR